YSKLLYFAASSPATQKPIGRRASLIDVGYAVILPDVISNAGAGGREHGGPIGAAFSQTGDLAVRAGVFDMEHDDAPSIPAQEGEQVFKPVQSNPDARPMNINLEMDIAGIGI